MNQNIKKVATTTIKKAGKKLLKEYKVFNRSTAKLKSHHEIVTRADLISEETIIKEIKKNFPAHSFLAEESGRSQTVSDYLWVIDPLDGTTNFSIHNPLWCVSMALAYRGKIVLGLVYSPLQDELFVAEKDRGAELNGRKIHISSMQATKLVQTYCHGKEERAIRKAIKYYGYMKTHDFDCRQLGSAAIELAYVACGRVESITIPGAHAWDVAAGVILVREAGGRVTDFKGQEWNLESRDMLASNGREHKRLLKIIGKV